jgi:protein-tyrosine phosphatase
MIDIHCHILPEVDDGAKSWDIALRMCAMAWKDGITHIVATPHCSDEFHYERSAHEELLQRLSEATGHKPALTLGCDFHFSYENVEELLQHPGRFTIGNTPYLLVEFSNYSLPPFTEQKLSQLINIGLKPIITHPERNPLLQKSPERVLDWVRGGCIVQVTGNALKGRWGRKAEATAKWLFEQQAVHVLASDAHGLDSRPPILSDAQEQARTIAGDVVAEALVNLNPRAIVAGEAVPYCPELSGK